MISINSLTVAYGGFTLLNDINFHISESDKIGLVGKNGAGKSTFLNLMTGILQPDSGNIERGETLRIGYYTKNHHEGTKNGRKLRKV